jgi:RNA polymerase sigma-70 factor (ECF subfamily)
MDDVKSRIVGRIPYLRRYARFRVLDLELADDLVQGCLLRAIKSIDTWQSGTNLNAWLFTILRNIITNHFRVNRQHILPLELDLLEQSLQTPGNQEQSLMVRDLQRAWDQLPDHQREVLFLAAVEGLDYNELADVLGIPLGTVRSRLSRAREALKRGFEGDLVNVVHRAAE